MGGERVCSSQIPSLRKNHLQIAQAAGSRSELILLVLAVTRAVYSAERLQRVEVHFGMDHVCQRPALFLREYFQFVLHYRALLTDMPVIQDRNASFYQPFFDTLVSSVGCTGASDKVACLRTVPLEALNVTLREQQSIWSFPSIDGVVYHELASVSLNAGKFAKVPLLIGSNSDEGASFGPKGINTTQQLRDYITSSMCGLLLCTHANSRDLI